MGILDLIDFSFINVLITLFIVFIIVSVGSWMVAEAPFLLMLLVIGTVVFVIWKVMDGS